MILYMKGNIKVCLATDQIEAHFDKNPVYTFERIQEFFKYATNEVTYYNFVSNEIIFTCNMCDEPIETNHKGKGRCIIQKSEFSSGIIYIFCTQCSSTHKEFVSKSDNLPNNLPVNQSVNKKVTGKSAGKPKELPVIDLPVNLPVNRSVNKKITGKKAGKPVVNEQDNDESYQLINDTNTVTQWINKFGYNDHGVCIQGEIDICNINLYKGQIKLHAEVAQTDTDCWSYGYNYKVINGGGISPISLKYHDRKYSSQQAATIAAYYRLMEIVKGKSIDAGKKEVGMLFKVFNELFELIGDNPEPEPVNVIAAAAPEMDIPAEVENTADTPLYNFHAYEFPKKGMFNGIGKQEEHLIIGECDDLYVERLLNSGHGIGDEVIEQKYILPIGLHKSRLINWSAPELDVLDKVENKTDITAVEPALLPVNKNISDPATSEMEVPAMVNESSLGTTTPKPELTAATKIKKAASLQDSYPGGKNASGVYQFLINQIPPVDCIISGFLGHCGLLKNIKPATTMIGMDIDKKVIDTWAKSGTKITLINDNFLNQCQWINPVKFGKTLVFLDPPYLMESRSSHQKIYDYEFATIQQHTELLQKAIKFPCYVMITAYENELYDKILMPAGFSKIHFAGQTRSGRRQETLYLNFPEPTELHDYTFFGNDYRARWNNKKISQRLIAQLSDMDALRRNFILSQVSRHFEKV